MELDSFSIDQRIKVQGKSYIGMNRIEQHGDTWRVKQVVEGGYYPWVEKDSLMLESIKDGTTAKWMNIKEDKHFKLI